MPDGEDVGSERRENDRRMLRLEERFSDYAKWRNEINIRNAKSDMLIEQFTTMKSTIYGENSKRIGMVTRLDRLERVWIGMSIVLMVIMTPTVGAMVALVFAMITGNVSITRIP